MLAAGLAAGCGGDGDDGGGTQTAREAQRCTNDAAGYAVRYPADWHTNSGEVTAACSYFHPSTFELPEQQEVTGVAIHVSREPVAFERVVRPGPAQRVLEREEVQVAGWPAERRRVEATGGGLLPQGTASYQYVVDVGDETLIASTHDVGELRFDRNREVLDRMMDGLELLGRPGAP